MAERIPFSSVPAAFDIDATTFITAAGITDFVQRIAINELVIDFKMFGLWSKVYAIYPFVGGTASTHKWNLKDPRDLDAAYRLVFTGGWVHSATGALPNGTSAYADTKLNSSILNLNSSHLSFYSRTNSASSSRVDIGSSNAGATYFALLPRNAGGLAFVSVFDGFGQAIAVADSLGMFIGTRTSSTILKLFKNNSAILSASYASGSLNNFTVTIGALNYLGTPNNFSNREAAFASIGDGLSDADCANMYTAVQKYNGYLNRSINAG